MKKSAPSRVAPLSKLCQKKGMAQISPNWLYVDLRSVKRLNLAAKKLADKTTKSLAVVPASESVIRHSTHTPTGRNVSSKR